MKIMIREVEKQYFPDHFAHLIKEVQLSCLAANPQRW